MPIHEVGRNGERKNSRGRRKKRKKARAERLDAGLKHHLDANNYSAKVGVNNHGAKIYGAKVAAKSSPRLL